MVREGLTEKLTFDGEAPSWQISGGRAFQTEGNSRCPAAGVCLVCSRDRNKVNKAGVNKRSTELGSNG